MLLLNGRLKRNQEILIGVLRAAEFSRVGVCSLLCVRLCPDSVQVEVYSPEKQTFIKEHFLQLYESNCSNYKYK